MTAGRCSGACCVDECDCAPAKVVQELRSDEQGRLTLRSIITPEWRRRMLDEPDAD